METMAGILRLTFQAGRDERLVTGKFDTSDLFIEVNKDYLGQ